MIIEFFGLPYSGKTTISSKLKNFFLNKKKISSYREIIFLHLYKPFDISDYTISFLRENDKDILHVIHFKCANISDYHFQHNRYFDQFTKYVR